MKNIRRNSFIILVVSAIFVVYILRDNFFETMRILRNANVFWLGLAVLLFFGHVTVEAFAMYKLTVKKEKKYPYKKIFKLFVMTKFFNGITPFATGGQPLQVYELKRDGIEVSKGTNIVVEHFILFQTSIMILGVISILLNRYFILFEYDPVATNLFVVGFIINAIILIVVYISSISKNTNK